MKISEFKNALQSLYELAIQTPEGGFIPAHFHITEAGLATKNFIDCGGVIRTEKHINFQLWVAGDTDHRLSPSKLLGIIAKSEKLFQNEDLDIEVEYQSGTIGKFGIDFQNNKFVLTPKFTNCLADDHCGIPEEKRKVDLKSLTPEAACCTPGGGCC
ncbi:MAG: hypothetical protein IPP51_18620 [Bacteroidetes bacterium]|nr:hypothetical protein [Bacteroidota bacterium]